MLVNQSYAFIFSQENNRSIFEIPQYLDFSLNWETHLASSYYWMGWFEWLPFHFSLQSDEMIEAEYLLFDIFVQGTWLSEL